MIIIGVHIRTTLHFIVEYNSICLFCFISQRLLDESVRWLIANKRIEEAKVIIEKVAKINKVNLNEVLPFLEAGTEDVEIQPLTESTPEENIPLEIHKAKKEDIYTILKHRTLLKTTVVMSFAW